MSSGRDIADGPPRGQLARLDPARIVYSEHMLRKEGFAPRQIWHADRDEVETKQGRQDNKQAILKD